MSLLNSLFDFGAHFGHQTRFWHPKMKDYIYCVSDKIHIINLDITVKKIYIALEYVEQVIRLGGGVMFVGTKRSSTLSISEHATRCKMPYVSHRWLGGLLTNYSTIKHLIKKYLNKKDILKQPDDSFTKKELLLLERQVNKLELNIGGIVDMKNLPTAIFVVDIGYHLNAVKEARKLGIKVIGIVDTNNDPSLVDYVIPANDDSAKAVDLYCSLIADKIIKVNQLIKDDLVKHVDIVAD